MAERRVGTVSRGIRCPIIREGDDLSQIVTDSVIEAAQIEGFELHDRDVISMTESIVARSQGNYCTVNDIASKSIGKKNEFDKLVWSVIDGTGKVLSIPFHPAFEGMYPRGSMLPILVTIDRDYP